jgi:hypothetical protein
MKDYGTVKVSHEGTQYSPTELKRMVASSYSSLTHYIRYFNIQPPDELCVATYCYNSSLLTIREEYHTGDVDSSSWYLKDDSY